MIKLGTNILSQTVQRNLGRSTQDLSRASERLSSGQRINRASDDAAGLAISMSLDKDRTLAQTAQRNVSDGVSMVNILSSGLSSQKEILFRMAELAEQSANGTYSTKQREALQKEYGSLMDEFDRVADSTEFNGVKLLRNPTPQAISIMAGITGGDTSLLTVTAANSHRYAGVLTQKSDVTENGAITVADASTAYNTLTDPTGAGSTVNPPSIITTPEAQDVAVIRFRDSAGNDGTAAILLSRSFGDMAPGGNVTKYSSVGGANISETPKAQYLFARATLDRGDTTALSSQITFSPSDTVPSSTISLSFASLGTSASLSFDFSSLSFELYDLPKDSYTPTAIGFTNVLNQYSSRRSLVVLKNRIDAVSSLEGEYGALVSRLGVAHSLLASSGENFAAAASRIKDADISSEAANSVRSGILQQAATSLLGQANQAPQVALSLLRGI